MARGSKAGISKKQFLLILLITALNIAGMAQWRGHKFTDTANFSNRTFNKCDFAKAKFLRGAYFYNDSLKAGGNFRDVTFDSDANFSNCIFFKNSQFLRDSFCKIANFDNATFLKDVYFFKAHFLKGAVFSSATFVRDVNFRFAQFKQKLDLSGIESDSGSFSFDRAELPDSIDLSNSLSINTIDLTLANLKDVAPTDRCFLAEYFEPYVPNIPKKDTALAYIRINLYKADISKIKIDYLHFRLWLENTIAKDDKNDPTWFKKHPNSNTLSDDQIASVYESLLKNFKDNGQTESIKNLDIEYQYFKAKGSWLFRLRDWWWRFGYEKWRIFKHIGFFLLIFTVLTFCFLDKLVEVYCDTHMEIKPKVNEMGFLQRLWFAFVYTCSIFFPISLKFENIKNIKSWWIIYIVIVFIAGLVCVAYLANFVLAK